VLDYEAKGARTGTGFAQGVLALCEAEGYRVQWLLETHAHADHLSAAEWLQQRTGAPVGIGAGIRAVQATSSRSTGWSRNSPPTARSSTACSTTASASPGRARSGVIATPGHTSDSLSYRIGDAVFVGDSIFMPDGGTARCDFPAAMRRVLYASIQRLYSLPDDTRVFVCHDYGPAGASPRADHGGGTEAREHPRARGTPAAEFVEVAARARCHPGPACPDPACGAGEHPRLAACLPPMQAAAAS
jgi:glyoxylase-like metal-dependent hydrolase (beta-lactamase superfamily II)